MSVARAGRSFDQLSGLRVRSLGARSIFVKSPPDTSTRAPHFQGCRSECCARGRIDLRARSYGVPSCCAGIRFSGPCLVLAFDSIPFSNGRNSSCSGYFVPLFSSVISCTGLGFFALERVASSYRVCAGKPRLLKPLAIGRSVDSFGVIGHVHLTTLSRRLHAACGGGRLVVIGCARAVLADLGCVAAGAWCGGAV